MEPTSTSDDQTIRCLASSRIQARKSTGQQLERAHIIGQSWPKEHNHVHWLMLKFGFKIKSRREIIGQIPRLVFGGIKSFVGKIPIGNTGGADVPPLRAMEIPEDLQRMIKPYRTI